MTDTPIHDTLGLDPMRTGRKTIRVDNAPLRIPLEREVADVIQAWLGRHTADLAAALAPFGIHPHDILPPTYERVIYEDEFAPEPPRGHQKILLDYRLTVPEPTATVTGYVCPECFAGKCGNCIEQTLDPDDNWVPCACPEHEGRS